MYLRVKPSGTVLASTIGTLPLACEYNYNETMRG